MRGQARVMLGSVQNAVGREVVTDAWRQDMELRATKVKQYRAYIDSEHDFDWLNEQQRTALKLEAGDEFVINHCENILYAFADRLGVTAIEGESDAASEWAAALLDENRFDALQLDVHDACPRDGDTYVMVSFDNVTGRARLTHEPAFDGVDGMMVVYASTESDEVLCALKVWHEVVDSTTTRTRLNVYYADRVEKLQAVNGGAFTWAYADGEAYSEDGGRRFIPWVGTDGAGLGVPVIHFRNRKRTRGGFGLSVLEAAIPVQNALNRTVHSMIAAGELSAFQIRYTIGVEAPKAVAPGTIWEVVPRDPQTGKPMRPDAGTAEWLKAVRIGAIEQGEIVPHLEAARYLRAQMYDVSGTPDYSHVGANASGESLKQMEIRLIGRIQRAQVYWGNAWEDVIRLAARIEETFGFSPPASAKWRCMWKDAEPRNDAVLIDTALKLQPYLSEREFLRLVAPIYGWDEAKIEEIMSERTQERTRSIQAAGAFLPRFDGSELEMNDDDAPGTGVGSDASGIGAASARDDERRPDVR